MTKNNKIGYAVAGLGVGMTHVESATASEKAELVAVCDLVEAKMKKVTDKYPNVIPYTDFDELEIESYIATDEKKHKMFMDIENQIAEVRSS